MGYFPLFIRTGEPRLSEIKNLNASAAVISKFDYLYDAQGQITTWTQQTATNDPAKYALKYDAGGRLLNANVTDTVTGAMLHDYDYIYDALGNRLSEQVDGNVTGASINRLNQLIGQSAGGKMTFSGTLSRPSAVTINGASANADTSSFYGTANVTAGTNTVAIVANDFNGQVTTNRYQVVVPPSSASYTYDVNGNLTDDGTRTYQWDAKDELTAIIYKVGSGDPNAGNHTDFTYNGSGQRVKIVERTGTAAASGTVINTKQYVFNEERDVNNVTTKRYFSQGEQRVSGGVPTNYFYTRDHLGSIREMLNTGGTIQVRYSYDPYGRRSKVSGALDCDLGFTGYYYHATSGYYLSPTRAYDPNAGRWISRDPSGEDSGLNLYAYCGGNPVCNTDSSGLCMDDMGPLTLNMMSPYEKNMMINSIITQMMQNHGNPFVAGPFGENVLNNPLEMLIIKTFIMPLIGDVQNAGQGKPGDFIFAMAMMSMGAEGEGAKITFGTTHALPHFVGTGLDQAGIESDIAAQLRTQMTGSTSVSGPFMGRVVSQGQKIEYRGFGRSDGTINIGTYYPIP